MARPTVHDPDLLLDVALGIAAEGPERLTMAGAARAAGAPSGSIYHRFAGRSALLGALWVRTVSRFQAEFVEAVRDKDPVRARVTAARHVIVWSRAHREAARALLHGVAAFDPADWPDEITELADRHARDLERSLDDLAARTPGGRARNRERLAFVTIDAPYAIVRRHLRRNLAIPGSAEELVEQCARTLAGTELPFRARAGARP